MFNHGPCNAGSSWLSRRKKRGSSQPHSPSDDSDPDEELELVFGGWNEGRRQDVEHEVNLIFPKTYMQDRLHAVIVPYIRVNICREGRPEVSTQRCRGVAESKNNELWMTKN